jgi:hypothetical protein
MTAIRIAPVKILFLFFMVTYFINGAVAWRVIGWLEFIGYIN